MNNIIQLLFDRNKSNPNKIVFTDNTGSITYSEFEIKTRRIAQWLINQGIKKGDNISLVLYDNINTVAVTSATILVGAVACMVNPRGKKENIEHQSSFVGPRLVIKESIIDLQNSANIDDVVKQSLTLDEWTEPCATRVEDLALMLWTSGTTGRGKAVMHNHRTYIDTCQKIGVNTIGVDSTHKIYTTAKLFFAIGMFAGFFWPMYASAESYLDSGPSIPARVRENIERYQPTIFYSVPIVYSQLATRKINCQALCLSGGDRLPQSVIDRWKEVSGQLIYNTSGVTEAALCYSYNKLGTPDAGTINDGYMMRVVDENNNELPYNQVGRLQIQTEYRALGYYNDPYWTEKMFGSEWISTGDYAYITELGHLNYMGRINDVIKINGKFVNPSEIEETLLNYTGIEQAAVISRTGDDDLEHIEAFLVAAPNVQLNTKDIRRHLLDKHEKHYCPRVIHLVNELPRTDTGKVQRFILKQS